MNPCSARLRQSIQILVLAAVAAGALLVAGCARNTIEHRRQERYGAYSALSPELRQLVDAGRIKIGMTMDAVYISWGKPSQVLQSETDKGLITTWLYQDTTLEPNRYWSTRYYNGRYGYPEPYYASYYYVRDFVSGEVIFEKGLVKAWHTLPVPVD
jgi:hypothetical protein